ncbi:monocarboxylate transporter 13-like isoform X2 [Ptychodera flava]|uniref:monocarboxylate transporter 13-like isoform X2 n=2 Tax=Ptychodera flava TaxID=63121 RepID=UPI00396A7EE9
MATGTSETTAPDGGWGWFIVIATFISTFLSSGNFYSFGVLYVAFLDAFGGTKSETAWIGSIFLLTFVTATAVSTALVKKIGHRPTVMLSGVMATTSLLLSSFATSLYQLYFTYGGLVGFGVGLAYIPCIDMTSKYFKKKLSLALGLGMAGTGAGQFLLSVGNQLLVDTYGWRGMLLILSAVSFHLCVAGALLRPLQPYQPIPNKDIALKESEHGDDIDEVGQGAAEDIAMSERESSEKENGKARKCDLRRCAAFFTSILTSMYDKEMLVHPLFLLQLLIGVGQAIGHATVSIHVVRRFRDFGIPATKSAFVSSFNGIGQLIGRPLLGAIANTGILKPHVLYGIAMATCGAGNLFGMYVESFEAQIFYITVFGMSMGGYFLLIPVVVNYFHGKDKIRHGTSMVLQAQGIVALLTSPLAGYMRDKYGGYEQAFWVVVGAYAVCTACAFSLGAVDKYLGRRRQKQADATISRTVSEAGNSEKSSVEGVSSV